MMGIKMPGDLYEDVEIVHEAICYLQSMVCSLEKECMVRDKGKVATELFICINGIKNEMDKLVSESVGMFTGLLDGNGTKVFEGDIVRGKHRYGIVWYQPHGCFKLMRHSEVFECSEFALKMKNVIRNLYDLKTQKERMYFYGKEE
jgi:hypothetical protein